VKLGEWIRQRSRWIKGYVQTWLVHMRAPGELLRAVGWRGFLGFQFFIGLPAIIFLSAPLVWLVTAFYIWLPERAAQLSLPGWFAGLALFNLACHIGLHWWQGFRIRRAVPPVHWDRLAFAIFLLPCYWMLHSIASYRALWQLIRRPHFWDKTEHGHSAGAFTLATETS